MTHEQDFKKTKRPAVECLTATTALTCCMCDGTIPEGHKYWFHNYSQRSEHTNCELYTKEFTQQRKREAS